MSGLTLHIGTPDEAAAPRQGFDPPAQPGIMHGTIKSVDSSNSKNYPNADMIKLGIATSTLIDGTPNAGWVEFLVFSVPPEFEEEYKKLNVPVQKGKLRNFLIDGLGRGESIAKEVDGKGHKKVSVRDPMTWKERAVVIDVTIKEREYEGKKRVEGSVQRFVGQAELNELMGELEKSGKLKGKAKGKEAAKEAPKAASSAPAGESLPDDDIPLD